ncbi:MAG: ribbon-helix-helix protein, CopG family [Dehalococcoidia bacterium]
MRISVSIPDHIFEKAEHLASRLKKSRSELYSEAVAEYLAKHDDAIASAINRVLDDPDASDPELDTFVAAWARRTLKQVEW